MADPQALQSLTGHDWLGLIHPVLMILFVYPVVGATIRLGILAREKRLKINPIADTVPVEHAQHGAWVTGGVLVAVLIGCLLYTSPSPRDVEESRMPSSA